MPRNKEETEGLSLLGNKKQSTRTHMHRRYLKHL